MAPSKEMKELRDWLDEKFARSKEQVAEVREALDNTTAALQHNIDIMEGDIHELKIGSDKTKSDVKTHEAQIAALKEQIVVMDIKSRRQNLKFTGISEEVDKSTKECLLAFLQDTLKLNAAEIPITSVYRVGKLGQLKTRSKAKQRPRPIIATFGNLDQVNEIKQAAYRRPKGSKGGVEPDLPKEMAEARQAVYLNIIKPAKQAGKNIKWIRNSLYVDGKLVYNTSTTADKSSAPAVPVPVATTSTCTSARGWRDGSENESGTSPGNSNK